MANDSGFKTGDLVIGSSDPSKSVYSMTGSKIIESGVSVFGDPQALEDQQKAITQSIIRNGGVRLPVGTPDKKQKKTTRALKQTKKEEPARDWEEPAPVYMPPEPPKAKPEKTIQFENDFGKMKAKVLASIEHSQAFMLVFKNEDSMVFEPKTGESLKFYNVDREVYDVYYPGVTFDSPDSEEKFMILFKIPPTDQE